MKIKIKDLDKSMNIIDYCAAYVGLLGSRTATKKALHKKALRLNGKNAVASNRVQNGDWLELRVHTVSSKAAPSVPIPLVYEDDYLVIVNKPGGIAVNGTRHKTVENGIKNSIQKSKQMDAFAIPVAAHRLDVPTKGLVILAKTKSALIAINKAFQAGTVHKTYQAIVHGQPAATGIINQPIQGKQARTKYRVLHTVPSRLFQHLSLLELDLLTGRTHQLRIHLQQQGHLIVGDKQYAGQQKTILGKGLFLCACQLAFLHPITKKPLQIEIPTPSRFSKLLEREGKRF